MGVGVASMLSPSNIQTWDMVFPYKFGVCHSSMNLFQVDIIVRDELCGAPLMYRGLKYLKALRM